MIQLDGRRLGEGDAPVTLVSRDDQRIAAARLVQLARRSLDIYSRDLDAAIYDDQDFIDAVRSLAIATKHKAVRILVKDSSRAVKYGHRLIPLAQRLTSFIEIRKPPAEYRDYNEAFLVVDGCGYIHRKLADRYEGLAHFNAGRDARRLVEFFDEVWQSSAPDPDLRRLYL